MIEFFGLTETGPVRDENQDAILLPDTASEARPGAAFSGGAFGESGAAARHGKAVSGPLLFAVADGMGGYAHGGLASRLALETFDGIVHPHPAGQVDSLLKRGVEAANLAVCQEANRLGVAHMGTTLTAASISGSRLHLAHVGDSRAYLVRNSDIRLLTEDHTVVGDLLRMHVLGPEQVRTHARRSVLTRAVGMSLFVQPDLLSIPLLPGDRFFLCSDGLWSSIQDAEFGQLAAEISALDVLCRTLLDLALERGADDNVSIIAVHVQSLPEAPAPEIPQTAPARSRWWQNLLPGRRTPSE
jgi:protein phosphatase